MTASPFWAAIHAHSRTRGSRIAIADQAESLTWNELVDAATRRGRELAEAIRTLGPLVALHRPSRLPWVVDLLALWQCGAVVASLPDAIPDTAARTVTAGLGARALVPTDGRLIAVPVETRTEALDAALIHLTSGTSGTAKGVVRGADNLEDEARAVAAAIALRPDETVLLATPASHSFAGGLLLAALHAGATVVLCAGFDPLALLALARRHNPAVLAATPYLFRVLAGRAERMPIPGLRLPICGGSPLQESWAQQWLDAFGIPIAQEYGLSEGGIATLNDSHRLSRPTSVGHPIPGVSIAVVDATGHPQPPNINGRIIIHRPHQPVSYIEGPGRFKPIPTLALACNSMLDTGDTGHLDEEGLLHLTGRTKAMINVAGVKVDPTHVESHLAAHPRVDEAVVIAISDPFRGEAPAALIESLDPPSIAELAAYLRERVTQPAVPRRWFFTDSLPRSPTGKPDRIRAHELILESS